MTDTFPRGVHLLNPGDPVEYLVDTGVEHPLRVLGWYYGYPACCVDAKSAGTTPGRITRVE